MKRIYLLMIALMAFAASSSAQVTRNVDVAFYVGWSEQSVGTYSLMMAGDTFFVNQGAGAPYEKFYNWRYYFHIPQTSADTLIASDVIFFRNPLTANSTIPFRAGLLTNVNGLGKDDTVNLGYPFPPQGQQGPQYSSFTINNGSGSTVTTLNWCDTIYAGVDTSARNDASKIIPDAVISNNFNCVSLTQIFWDVANSVNNIEVLKGDVVLYPNPATNKLEVKYNFAKPATEVSIKVLNATGQVQVLENFSGQYSQTQSFPLDVSKLAAGIYFINMTADNGDIISQKFNVIR